MQLWQSVLLSSLDILAVDVLKDGSRKQQARAALRSFDAADKATQLHNSVDIDFARALHDDSSNVDSFPALPSDKRIRDSLQAYRQMVSAPVVSQCVCAVCAERDFVSQMTAYHIGDFESCQRRLELQSRCFAWGTHGPADLRVCGSR